MIRINLLPPEIKQARRLARQQLYLGIAVGCLVLLLVLGNLFLRWQTVRIRQHVDVVQKQREAVEVSVQEHEPYVDLQAQMQGRRSLLQQVMGAPPDWVTVLRRMGEDIPEHVWLTDLRLTAGAADEEGEDRPGDMMMRGYTYDHTDTADWLDTVQKMSGVEDVRCSFSVEESYGRFLVVEFEVSSLLPPGDEFAPPEAGDDD